MSNSDMNPNDQERIGLLDDDRAQATQAKTKANGGIDKQNLGKFAAFVGVAVVILGGMMYLKISKNNQARAEADESKDRPSIARPVENTNVDDFDFNQTRVQVPPPAVPASIPAPGGVETVQPDEAELARLQQAQAMIAVREKSSLMVQGGSGGTGLAPSAGGAEEGKNALPPELQAIYSAMGLNVGGQQQKETSQAATQGGRFGTGLAQAPVSHAAYTEDRRFLIQQGKLLDAVLETAIKSDIPSSIIARTTEDIYGEQGRYPLLPAGTRLFGEYSSVVHAGQTEVAAVWRRAITPQGVEIMLDSPSTNNLGIAGMGGRVNNHFFRQFSTAAMLSLFGAGTANVGVRRDDRNNSSSQYRTAVAQAFTDTSRSLLEKHADIPPTITVEHGTRIKVLVAKDLDFSTLLQ